MEPREFESGYDSNNRIQQAMHGAPQQAQADGTGVMVATGVLGAGLRFAALSARVSS